MTTHITNSQHWWTWTAVALLACVGCGDSARTTKPQEEVEPRVVEEVEIIEERLPAEQAPAKSEESGAVGIDPKAEDPKTAEPQAAEPAVPPAANTEPKKPEPQAAEPKAAEAAPAAGATAHKLIPRQTLFGNPDKASARISPDGSKLSYLAPSEGVLNVFVAPVDDPAAAKPVTQDKYRGIRAYFWAYDSKHILYAQDSNGDEDFHVYSVDLATGTIKDLTPYEKVAAQIQEVSDKFPGEILIGLNDRDPSYHDIYRVDIVTGDRKLVEKNTEYTGYVTDEDFQVRLAQKFLPDGGTQLYQRAEDGGWKEFQKIESADTLTTSPAGFDKSGQVLYMTDSRGRDTSALVQFDLRTGEQQVLASDERADLAEMITHPTEKNVQAVSFNFEKTRWQVLDASIEEDLHFLHTSDAHADLQITSRTQDDKFWVVAYVRDDGPTRYYLYDRDKSALKFLFTNREALNGLALAKMHPVVIKSRDGLNLVSYLTLPLDNPSKGEPVAAAAGQLPRPAEPLPLILLVHGGPWARDSWGYDTEHQLFANRGYAVLSVNYRGSTGLGKNFTNAGNKEWAAKMHDDLLDAVDWAVKEKIADPARVAIMGGSYGGYATLVGLTFTPDRFACGVDIVGPSNLLTLLSTIPAYWAPAMQLFKDRVGDPTTDEGKAFLNERSPLGRVDKIQKPLLIGQGANDPRVKQSEADQIVEAMRSKQIPVTYVLFPDEGHGFARPMNNLAFYAVAEAFLAKQLGGQCEPIGDDFTGSTIQVPEGAQQIPGLDDALKSRAEQK